MTLHVVGIKSSLAYWLIEDMLGLLRRFCSFLVHLALKVVRSFGASKTSSRSVLPQQEETQGNDQWAAGEWDQGGGEWEPFTVQVVSHESPTDEPTTAPIEEPTDIDLFSDMQPVFKKPTRVSWGRIQLYLFSELNPVAV